MVDVAKIIAKNESKIIDYISERFETNISDLLINKETSFEQELNELKTTVGVYVKGPDKQLYGVIGEIVTDDQNQVLENIRGALLSS